MSWHTAIKRSKASSATSIHARPVVPLHTPDLRHIVTLDFETYFDSDYTLRKLSTSEYVRDPRFKAHMMAIKVGTGKTRLVDGPKIASTLRALPWSLYGLVCHNTAFDGFILSHHYGIVPRFYYDTLSMARGLHKNDIGASLGEVAQFYGKGNKLPDVLGLSKGVTDLRKEMVELHGMHAPLHTFMASYCMVDVDLCHEIFVEMVRKYPENEIQLIDRTIRMFCTPKLQVDRPRVEEELKREIAEKRETLLALAGGPAAVVKQRLVGGLSLDDIEAKLRKQVASNVQFALMLRDAGVEPPMKISPSWLKKAEEDRDPDKKWAYAFSKSDEEFIALKEHPKAKVRALVDARLAVKSTLNETRAERFLRASENGAALPVLLSYYGAHCVPGDTEVLTPDGWKKLAEWTGGEIAQVNEQREIQFLSAERFTGPTETEWLDVKAPYLSCLFTLGHTMPYLKHTSYEWATEKAGDFARRRSRFVPVSGTLISGGGLTSEAMRVIAMVQADGSFEEDPSAGRRMCVFLKKLRKVQRAREILQAAGINYEEQTYPSHPEFVRFIVRYKDYPSWFSPALKTFGAWLLDSSPAARAAFIDELPHWDGWEQGGKRYYCTTVEPNAEWVQTLAHLSGFSANINIKKDARGTRKPLFIVGLRNRDRALVRAGHMGIVRRPIPTFCTLTQTGFWLARRDGHIFVTGNTGRWSAANRMNMQNLPRGGELRKAILAPKGHVIVVADSGQIEARMNAWLWGEELLLDAFRASDAYEREQARLPKDQRKPARGADRDAYCRFADEVYGFEVCKDLHEEQRFVGKVGVLGLGYKMGAKKLQSTLALGMMGPPVKFTQSQCQQIVNAYRRANARIVQGWALCGQIINDMSVGREGSHKGLFWEKERIWLPNGMCLKYPNLRGTVDKETGWTEWTFDRKNEPTRLYDGLLCENLVQALSRIVVGEQLLAISSKYPIVMFTHDENVALARTSQAEKAAAFMLKAMQTPPAWCADIPLNADVKFAENYSK